MASTTIWWITKQKDRESVLPRVGQCEQSAEGTPQQGIAKGLRWGPAAGCECCGGWTSEKRPS